MILGVMSDTHGNVRLMSAVADMLRRAFAVELILHLGDDYRDAELLEMSGHTVLAVPGLWCPEYHGHRAPKARVHAADGIVIGLAHAEQDLSLVQAGADLLLTGHSHAARIVLENGVVRMNPGHLRRVLDRGEKASFGLVNADGNRLSCSIYEADGSLRYTRAYERVPGGCFISAQ